MADPRLKRAWPLWVLALLVSAAWLVRRPPTRGADVEVGRLAPGFTSEVAYRTRAVQLSLAGGAVDRDRYLGHPAASPAPFSPQSAWLLSILAGGLARAGVLGSADPAADPSPVVAEEELERLIAVLPGYGAALACLLAYLALSGAGAGGERRVGSALAAAAAQALAPPLLVAEGAGTAVVAPLAASLLFAQVHFLGGVVRGRDLSDATLAGMLAGGCAGLAILLTSTSVVTVLGAVAWMTLRTGRVADERRADAWRALGLYVMAAVVAISVLPAGESTLALRAVSGAGTAGWWARALLPVLVLSVGLASRIALGPAPGPMLESALDPALDPAAGRGGALGWRRAVRGAALPAVCALAIFALGGQLRAEAADAARSGPARDGALAWMRARTPSSGPFNHADAPQDWGVLAAPEWAGWISYRGRRPAVAARFATASAGGATRAVEAGLREVDTGAFALRLRELGVRYVVVGPTMIGDRFGLEENSALVRLSTSSSYPGLERVHATEAWCDPRGRPTEPPGDAEEPCADAPGASAVPVGPVVSIWRARLAPRSVPRARPVRDAQPMRDTR